eukprot:scaffold10121_cov112-Isochrysis_galbana.AAC.7
MPRQRRDRARASLLQLTLRTPCSFTYVREDSSMSKSSGFPESRPNMGRIRAYTRGRVIFGFPRAGAITRHGWPIQRNRPARDEPPCSRHPILQRSLPL